MLRNIHAHGTICDSLRRTVHVLFAQLHAKRFLIGGAGIPPQKNLVYVIREIARMKRINHLSDIVVLQKPVAIRIPAAAKPIDTVVEYASVGES